MVPSSITHQLYLITTTTLIVMPHRVDQWPSEPVRLVWSPLQQEATNHGAWGKGINKLNEIQLVKRMVPSSNTHQLYPITMGNRCCVS